MERAQVLRWRLDQEDIRVQRYQQAALDRDVARALRPLLTPALATWAEQQWNTSTVISLQMIPSHQIVCDRECMIVEQPIRDYLTTKAFSIPTINGTFVITIHHSFIQLQFITVRYQIRNRYVGDDVSGVWYPPGAYTETLDLSYVRISSPELYQDAIRALLDISPTVIESIMIRSRTATRSKDLYKRSKQFRSVGMSVVWILYVGLFVWMLVWFALVLFA